MVGVGWGGYYGFEDPNNVSRPPLGCPALLCVFTMDGTNPNPDPNPHEQKY